MFDSTIWQELYIFVLNFSTGVKNSQTQKGFMI